MSTSWSEIVTASMTVIDDERLNELLTVSPAQFYRRMSDYVKMALPALKRPPELLKYLQSGMTPPDYTDAEWTSTAASTTAATVIPTGKIGYDLCSVILRSSDPAGGVLYEAYPDAVYDAETGDVTFPIQPDIGIQYLMDFYKDGEFSTLTENQMELFALAVAVLWDRRFERTWLNLTVKVHDSTFDVVNESNYLEKSSQRLIRNVQDFNDKLKAYEQLCAYETTTSKSASIVLA